MMINVKIRLKFSMVLDIFCMGAVKGKTFIDNAFISTIVKKDNFKVEV